jgi:bifunctional non-homologous end joining protein LigD
MTAFTNLDKILWPNDGYTKGDLIEYYGSVSRWLLPHLRERPLTLERFPNGVKAASFFEKEIPKGAPDWVARETVSSEYGKRSKITYLVCNDKRTLQYLANLAAIVLHPWISHVGSLDEPDFVLFDLDPQERCTLKTLATVALGVRDCLAEIGLHPLVKTSGATGLHVVLPLSAGYGYDTVKLFGEVVARRLAFELGDAITLERTIAKRTRTAVYFDYQQVGRGKTIVAPYVVRARDGAPVSMPLQWSEVEGLRRSRIDEPFRAFEKHTMRTAPKRLGRDGDLWGGRNWRKARLEPAIAKAQQAWR